MGGWGGGNIFKMFLRGRGVDATVLEILKRKNYILLFCENCLLLGGRGEMFKKHNLVYYARIGTTIEIVLSFKQENVICP